MTAAMTLIGSITLTAAQTSVTFGLGGTLPQAYRDLYLVVNWGNTASTGDMLMRFNGDTSNTYTYVEMSGDGASAGSGSGTRTGILFGWTNAATSNWVNAMHIMDYAQTDKHKTVLTRAGAASIATSAKASRWPSTSAITSLVINAGSSTFTAGSTFYLYGIAG